MAPAPVDEDRRTWASPRTPTLKKGDLIQDKEHPDDFGLIVGVDESREDPYRVYVFSHIGEENRCYCGMWKRAVLLYPKSSRVKEMFYSGKEGGRE